MAFRLRPVVHGWRHASADEDTFAFNSASFSFPSTTQQYIDEIKNIDKCKLNLKSLAKPVLGFLKEEQPEAVEPIKAKLESLGEQIFR